MISILDSRKKAILELVIVEHIRSAEPVGSEWLSTHSDVAASPATVRNELLALEEAGYLSHPHTSAGRVPTEQGYRWFVTEAIGEVAAGKAATKELAFALHQKDRAAGFKDAAKTISDLAEEAVFLGLSEHSFFYTGFVHLFNQPEFADRQMLAGVSAVIDRFDDVLAELFDLADDEPRAFIGTENPLGKKCGMVVVRLPGRGGAKMCGLFGPMRMDYEKIMGLLQALRAVS